MFSVLRARAGAAAVAIGAMSVLTVTAGPAQAAVNPANCQFSYNLSIGRVAADCWNPTESGWYIQLTCERFRNGSHYYARGSIVYGSGVSAAQCDAHTSEIAGVDIVNI
ncbi:hypothetical protein SAMN05421833_11413 [Microbispora rosea]|uniref:Uncharacterized protein n=1 Tax=Microbispora rosea TaxID=58117 RepID=A0A1N7DAE5_9ACTN|nr:hypothetical protein [Microbispora rosea]GIH49380.1 hypothetical protein Mro03_45590 [Microbispora rosea subsp. rosea]SIR72782.1 hypothetical protein SAMN05421833_11413 [Microbispora rosea]